MPWFRTYWVCFVFNFLSSLLRTKPSRSGGVRDQQDGKHAGAEGHGQNEKEQEAEMIAGTSAHSFHVPSCI